ncbi:MFS transporter [Streptomyces noursei ZPM]|uniref:Multidrug efflux pump Tap n=2 Tax=Streptomyces noursei TaxID=1971 RepID=A0A401RA24_STRNR|nr:MFS transporter [Streptomyces noursei]AKA06688.1 MFS transporter [Streptomyces noursei ZPM]EXU92576.1 MFS transporter [Streptomyces noursei PD-1]UWS75216.1 MFS transporter [Streptomyces noursei]GCB94491.1 MFS transporter [Streptomyces noursei]
MTAHTRRHARRIASSPLRGVYLPRSADGAAFAMTTYGIPLLVLATTGSATLTGLAFALEWVPRLAAFTIAGTLVDRHGTTAVFRTACVLRAAVVLAGAVLLAIPHAGVPPVVTVMTLAPVTGVLTEVSYVAVETAGGEASRAAGAQAHRVQAVLLGIDQTAMLAGPLVSGLLLQHGGTTAMLSILAAFSLLAAALNPRQSTEPRSATSRSGASGLLVGWATLRSLPALAWLVGGLVVSNIAIGLLQAAMPVIVVNRLGHSSAEAGLIWSAAAIASLLAITVARRAIDRWGLWPVGAVSAALAATATLALSQADTYRTYLLLIAVVMAGEGGLTVVLRTLRSHLIPPHVFGSTLALTILLLLAPFPAAGLLVAVVPPAQLGHLLAAAALLQALGLAIALTRLRALPAALSSPA